MSEQDIEKLIENYNKAQTENATLQTEITTPKEEMALMQSQLDWFKKQMFGRKSEQSSIILEGGEQLTLMPDEKAISEKDHEETITVPEHKRKKKRTFEESMADLPVEKVIHDLEDKTCDKCGAEMIEIGKGERDELVLKLSISLDTITTKKRAVHRFRAGGKSSHRRRRLALGRF